MNAVLCMDIDVSCLGVRHSQKSLILSYLLCLQTHAEEEEEQVSMKKHTKPNV